MGLLVEPDLKPAAEPVPFAYPETAIAVRLGADRLVFEVRYEYEPADWAEGHCRGEEQYLLVQVKLGGVWVSPVDYLTEQLCDALQAALVRQAK